jgi:hypothetical protein
MISVSMREGVTGFWTMDGIAGDGWIDVFGMAWYGIAFEQI